MLVACIVVLISYLMSLRVSMWDFEKEEIIIWGMGENSKQNTYGTVVLSTISKATNINFIIFLVVNNYVMNPDFKNKLDNHNYQQN